MLANSDVAFAYDLWGKKNKNEQLCSYDVFGVRTCGYSIKFSNPWREWQKNVEDPTYESSIYERHASWRYSDLAIGHYLETNGANTGVCKISNKYGTVCLLRDAGDTAIHTYRFSRYEWGTMVSGSPTEATVASNIIASPNARMTLGAGNVDWMDIYHCEKNSADNYTCAAFQPDWRKGKRDEGYPRFGPNEAKSGEFSFMLLTGASTTANAYSWMNI